jgi:phage tail sheath protein FI
LLKSWEDYESQWGAVNPQSYLGYAVKQFFENGGKQAYVLGLTSGDGGVLTPCVPGNAGEFEKALMAGIHQLDSVGFNLLCVPGETDCATIAQLQAYCAGRKVFLLVDAQMNDTVETLASGPNQLMTGANAMVSAFYFPWINAMDFVTRQVRAFPPCGFVAGLMAETDTKVGVWKAPMGILRGVKGAAVALTQAQSDSLNQQGINTVMETRVTSAGTLDKNSVDWNRITARRLAFLIENSVQAGTAWVAQEPNNAALWEQINTSVESFLTSLFAQGALAGQTVDEAFRVECGLGSTMTGDNLLNGNVNLTIMYAPAKPSVFEVLTFTLNAIPQT